RGCRRTRQRSVRGAVRRRRPAPRRARPFPVPGSGEGGRLPARRRDRARRAPAASRAHPRRARGPRPAVILVAGAGPLGAGIAYRLAERGADVVLCDRGEIASGSTSRAMGGVRQQFSTAAEVRLAQESIAFFAELGPPFFHQVGYLFVATTEDGLGALEKRRVLQAGPRVAARPGAPPLLRRAQAHDALRGAVPAPHWAVAPAPRA